MVTTELIRKIAIGEAVLTMDTKEQEKQLSHHRIHSAVRYIISRAKRRRQFAYVRAKNFQRTIADIPILISL